MQSVKWQYIIYFIIGTLLVSCAPPRLVEQRWVTGDPTLPEIKNLGTPVSLRVSKNSILQFQKQSVYGVEIENTFHKTILVDGVQQYASARWLEKVPLSLMAEITIMKSEKSLVLSRFFSVNPEFNTKKIESQPEVVLVMQNEPKLFWKIVFAEKDGLLKAVYLDRFFKLKMLKAEGSGLSEVMAYLYPDGPLKSKISAVEFNNLNESGLLKNDKFQILTQSGALAKAVNGQLLYTVGDNRFSQVQVYHYLNLAQRWFEDHFQFQLPFTLDAETAMGFPERTNTAFYYAKKIRLGEGDGVTFENIPLDPSIVIHESMHAIIEAVAGLTYDGQSGSLNEAFADFFTAMILKNPRLGEASYKKASFKRTIDIDLQKGDMTGGLYHDSQIVSSLLWELSREFGQEQIQKLAWSILIRLHPGSDFNDFQTELFTCLRETSLATNPKALAILKARGWSE